MPACKDCQFFERINEVKGICFGYTVLSNRPSEECPAAAFTQKEEPE